MPTRNRPVMKRVATEALRVEDADEAPPPHVPKKRVRVLQELASHNSRGLQEDAGGIIGGNPLHNAARRRCDGDGDGDGAAADGE